MYIHVFIHMYICTYMYLYICIYAHTCIFSYMHVHVFMHGTHIYTYIRVFLSPFGICMCVVAGEPFNTTTYPLRLASNSLYTVCPP